jgi:hypothetical protein
MTYVTHDSKGNPRRESNPWLEDTLEKEIKRLKEEKLEWEETSREILKEIKRIKKSKRYGSKNSLKRIEKMLKCLPEIKNRHYNISMRIGKLEWDYCNIVKIIHEECVCDDCDCKKINIIRFPKTYVHYAKKECSKCGRWQKFLKQEEYAELTGLDITS